MIYVIISLFIIIISIIFNKEKNIAEFTNSDSTHLIDGWSLNHLNSGIIYQLIVKNMKFNNKLLYGFIIAILFEIFENSKIGVKIYSTIGHFKSYKGDTLSNALIDIVFFMLGYCISYNINNTYMSIIIFLLNEYLVYLLYKWHFCVEIINFFTNSS